MKPSPNYLKSVRNQYEQLPYPPRDPDEERTRLLRPILAELQPLDHYCFGGKKDFSGARVLVAGAGTGDATIFLAHQLAPLGGQVVSLDISKASSNIVKQRAKVRGLTNIEWVHGSLMDLPDMGLEPFDFINCSGVLHHLADPDAGLLALKSVLAPNGAIGIMLYATYGRAGVYQMQALLRLLNQGESTADSKVKTASAVLDCIPPSNWFAHNHQYYVDIHKRDPSGIYDLLLHSQDRAYTVPEIYGLVAQAGLHFGGFASPTDRWLMCPQLQNLSPRVLRRMLALPLMEQQAAMELFVGNIMRHCFYVTASDHTAARIDEWDNVPYLFNIPSDFASKFADELDQSGGKEVTWKHPKFVLSVTPGKYSATLLRAIDGKRSLSQLYAAVRDSSGATGKKAPTDEQLATDFAPVWEAFNRMDYMLLRHSSCELIPVR